MLLHVLVHSLKKLKILVKRGKLIWTKLDRVCVEK